ncbi:hypothetical protein N8T08_009673 [Aspergillus melleus]|uniref:Uncharacterized protein n=1 Tax=Aspergillus melleus TaxID=138277 RepID=A0ACC3ATX0_9EURO|nr:hypothetical protein N8T08_009673 [Aspergillus melleus]
MSFGFSIGDFVAIIDHANKIRKQFVEAPAQFSAISNEVRNLSFVMQDVEVDLFSKFLDDRQKEELCRIAESCRCVLVEIVAMIANYTELGFNSDRKGKTVKRAWKRLRWKPADVLDLRSRLISNVGLLNAFNGQITHKSLAKLVRHQDNQERQAILDWLSPMTYGAKQHDYISRRQPGTGQWLLDSPELQDWLIKPKQTLFCPGVPGAGKTIFSSVLIDELQSLYGHRCDIGVAFIYCNFQRQKSRARRVYWQTFSGNLCTVKNPCQSV